MKLSVRLSIFAVIMVIVTYLLCLFDTDVAIPWMLSKGEDYIAVITIALAVSNMFFWTVLCNFFGKLLKCDELIDIFLKNDE